MGILPEPKGSSFRRSLVQVSTWVRLGGGTVNSQESAEYGSFPELILPHQRRRSNPVAHGGLQRPRVIACYVVSREHEAGNSGYRIGPSERRRARKRRAPLGDHLCPSRRGKLSERGFQLDADARRQFLFREVFVRAGCADHRRKQALRPAEPAS